MIARPAQAARRARYRRRLYGCQYRILIHYTIDKQRAGFTNYIRLCETQEVGIIIIAVWSWKYPLATYDLIQTPTDVTGNNGSSIQLVVTSLGEHCMDMNTSSNLRFTAASVPIS